MSEVFYNGVWRMDWGLGNPNTTAAFIATLMLGVWILAYVRKIGFWIALVACTALGVAIVHTISRGGIIAFAAGLIPLLAFSPRPWPRRRVVATMVAFWTLAGASVCLKASERYTQGIVREDRSISNRFILWGATPKMMVDSPSGWGLGNAANAFMQWYQPLERHEVNSTLVNSHLTWMVEMSWPARFAYVTGWLLVFVICWPSTCCRWLSICLGVWIAFFVASVFNSSAHHPVVWIVPLGLLAAAVTHRVLRKNWPAPLTLAMPPLIAIIILGLFAFMGSRQGQPRLFGGPESVTVNAQNPSIWVIYNEMTMGTRYGKTIRETIREHPSKSLGILFRPDKPQSVHTLVLGGKLKEEEIAPIRTLAADADSLILLSPQFFPEEIGIDDSARGKVTVYFGNFTQSPSVAAWRRFADVRDLEGIGDFIPNWTRFLLDPSNTTYGIR